LKAITFEDTDGLALVGALKVAVEAAKEILAYPPPLGSVKFDPVFVGVVPDTPR